MTKEHASVCFRNETTKLSDSWGPPMGAPLQQQVNGWPATPAQPRKEGPQMTSDDK